MLENGNYFRNIFICNQIMRPHKNFSEQVQALSAFQKSGRSTHNRQNCWKKRERRDGARRFSILRRIMQLKS